MDGLHLYKLMSASPLFSKDREFSHIAASLLKTSAGVFDIVHSKLTKEQTQLAIEKLAVGQIPDGANGNYSSPLAKSILEFLYTICVGEGLQTKQAVLQSISFEGQSNMGSVFKNVLPTAIGYWLSQYSKKQGAILAPFGQELLPYDDAGIIQSIKKLSTNADTKDFVELALAQQIINQQDDESNAVYQVVNNISQDAQAVPALVHGKQQGATVEQMAMLKLALREAWDSARTNLIQIFHEMQIQDIGGYLKSTAKRLEKIGAEFITNWSHGTNENDHELYREEFEMMAMMLPFVEALERGESVAAEAHTKFANESVFMKITNSAILSKMKRTQSSFLAAYNASIKVSSGKTPLGAKGKTVYTNEQLEAFKKARDTGATNGHNSITSFLQKNPETIQSLEVNKQQAVTDCKNLYTKIISAKIIPADTSGYGAIESIFEHFFAATYLLNIYKSEGLFANQAKASIVSATSTAKTHITDTDIINHIAKTLAWPAKKQATPEQHKIAVSNQILSDGMRQKVSDQISRRISIDNNLVTSSVEKAIAMVGKDLDKMLSSSTSFASGLYAAMFTPNAPEEFVEQIKILEISCFWLIVGVSSIEIAKVEKTVLGIAAALVAESKQGISTTIASPEKYFPVSFAMLSTFAPAMSKIPQKAPGRVYSTEEKTYLSVLMGQAINSLKTGFTPTAVSNARLIRTALTNADMASAEKFLKTVLDEIADNGIDLGDLSGRSRDIQTIFENLGHAFLAMAEYKVNPRSAIPKYQEAIRKLNEIFPDWHQLQSTKQIALFNQKFAVGAGKIRTLFESLMNRIHAEIDAAFEETGDPKLKEVANDMKNFTRTPDVCARLGIQYNARVPFVMSDNVNQATGYNFNVEYATEALMQVFYDRAVENKSAAGKGFWGKVKNTFVTEEKEYQPLPMQEAIDEDTSAPSSRKPMLDNPAFVDKEMAFADYEVIFFASSVVNILAQKIMQNRQYYGE